MDYNWERISTISVNTIINEQEKKILRIQIAGQFYCLIYDGHKIYAIKDKCPHAGARLSDGWCIENTIVCPLHRMTFDFKTGREVNGAGYGVEVFPIKHEKDGYYIGLPRKWWQF